MIGHVGAALSSNPSVPQPQSAQVQKPAEAALNAQPASQTPSSAEASQVVLPVSDTDNSRGADLQPQLNQQPQETGTGGVNRGAIKILEEVQENASKDEFREELNTRLAAAGQDPTQPMVDVRI